MIDIQLPHCLHVFLFSTDTPGDTADYTLYEDAIKKTGEVSILQKLLNLLRNFL